MGILKKRIRKQTLHELLILPEREEREETPEFRNSKKQLKNDGHWECFICETKENLEVHHFGCEYSLRDACDLNKLKKYCEMFDIYGYGKMMESKPILSVDDIRNCMIICRQHHVSSDSDGVANGIHNITFPTWITQKLQKDGENIVPNNMKEVSEEMNS